ncbi:class F sortase [Cellulomonas sp. URHB0016]
MLPTRTSRPGERGTPPRASARAPRGRRLAVVVALAAALGLLTACSTPAGPVGPAPARPSSAPPGPSAASPPVPSVPVHDAALGAQTAPAAPPPPARLVVPEVSIDMAVDAVGVLDDGEMEIPEDADRAGWYRFGPAPGDAAGATVLAAHVDSRRTGIGPMARLREVEVGTTLTVTTADGHEHGYRVVDVAKVSKEGAPVDQWFDRAGPPRLVLVTCGGTFRRDIGHYTDNVVVTAEPLGG